MKRRISLFLVILATLVGCSGAAIPSVEELTNTNSNASEQPSEAPAVVAADQAPAEAAPGPTEAPAAPEGAAVVEEIASGDLPHVAGQITLQVQVPTTADQPPTLQEHSGMSYFTIPTSTGDAVLLLAIQGLRWTAVEQRDDSANAGVINYWLHGEPLEGTVTLQAQVPTTADQAPQVFGFNGQNYINIQTSKGANLQLIPVQGFTWSEVVLNPDSATEGIINYWLKANTPDLAAAAPVAPTEAAPSEAAPEAVVEQVPCPEGWTSCRTLESPSITLVGSRLVSQAAMDSVAHIYQDMLSRLQPQYSPDVFDGFMVYITNGEPWSELQHLKPVGTMWPGTVERGIPQGDDLRGGASNRFLWIEEQMICKTGVATRNEAHKKGLRSQPDNSPRTFDQVVHEFSHSIHMNYKLDDQIKQIFNTSGMSAIERFPWAVQNKFGTPAGTLTDAEQQFFDQIFSSSTTYTCDLYQP